MPTQIQLRRGTTSEHSSFTGAAGEVTVDTTKKALVVHDGSTAGGIPVARDSTVVHTTGNETVAGVKTFSSDTVHNGVNVGRGAGAVANNTAVGYQALYANTTGAGNTAVGAFALDAATTGGSNTAVGIYALTGLTTGVANAAFGEGALLGATTSNYNSAFGYQALASNTTASNNTAVGFQAGYSNQTSGGAVFIGYQAGFTSTGISTTINYNTAIGYQAGYALTSGYGNTLVGNSSGNAITSGYKNSILGSYNGNQGGLDIRTASNYIVLSDGDGNPRIYHNGTTPYITQMSAGAGTYAVKINGTTGAITYDTSSARYKDNIRDSIYGLSHVMQIRPAQFEYKDSGRSDVGLIAEELSPIIPELVMKDKDGELDAVSYDRMVSVLIKAIQELKTDLDATKAELAALKGA